MAGVGLLTPKLLDDSFGALFIGFAVSTLLFGILLAQVVSYYRLFRGDGLYVRLMVPLICLLETVDQVFIAHGSYHYLVTLWGNPAGLISERPLPTLVLGQTFGTLVGTLVKGVFAYRVWRFSGQNYIVTGCLVAVILAQFICGMYYSHQALAQPTFLAGFNRLANIATLSLSLGAASDFITAAALAYYLRKMRTGDNMSDSLVNSLFVYGLGTGFASGGLSVLTVLLYNLERGSLASLACFFVLSKVLAISFMTSLNTRKAGHAPPSPLPSNPLPVQMILPTSSSSQPHFHNKATNEAAMYEMRSNVVHTTGSSQIVDSKSNDCYF
ncbi:hypothetical protein DL96DRAFT_1589346 [Flagelloscypha sp. PMI_526]|nr:hypothetical protein DL96DRAFT_1589346 [Flagelloscypha sp. PMI_526]